jgi:hypothetical protein
VLRGEGLPLQPGRHVAGNAHTGPLHVGVYGLVPSFPIEEGIAQSSTDFDSFEIKGK